MISIHFLEGLPTLSTHSLQRSWNGRLRSVELALIQLGFTKRRYKATDPLAFITDCLSDQESDMKNLFVWFLNPVMLAKHCSRWMNLF